ncbi:hypothetical protein [Methylobacterium sp. Leaf118]|uniref:hypothetical protein n=1 Tax=Methylobacterium sp. Leaf118 TaxID=2876562 RepID=UPI001E297DE0|nr:hypothetical protein [Methylobacterium sp. Leaf118]
MSATVAADKGTAPKAAESTLSAEELLKQAVGAGPEPRVAPVEAPAPGTGAPRTFRLGANGRLAAAASIALACGLTIGLNAAPRERSGEALGQLRAGIEAGRAETQRLAQDVDRLARAATALREASEAARGEIKALNTSLTERIGRTEQALDRRLAALSDTMVQAEREQSVKIAGLATQMEKKPPLPPSPVAALPAKAETKPEAKLTEPVQTGSLPDKAKPDTVEGWAVRDVYDGVAILEDRRRRLVEVGAGDAVPGVGRVEAIERRGRAWVVVTRQGVITPQAW